MGPTHPQPNSDFARKRIWPSPRLQAVDLVLPIGDEPKTPFEGTGNGVVC